MRKLLSAIAVVAATTAMGLAFSSPASAHNRAHVILPSGECIIVGSEKSVTLPDGSLLDLYPETTPQDEIGTAYAARAAVGEDARLGLGPCP